MAIKSKRKLDEKLVEHFSKLRPININRRQSVLDQYMDLWNQVITNTPLEDTCIYTATDTECGFTITDSDKTYCTLTYPYKEVHNSDDPGDICWDIILFDALTYIKKNKIINKRNVRTR